jgi:hypothetical protein
MFCVSVVLARVSRFSATIVVRFLEQILERFFDTYRSGEMRDRLGSHPDRFESIERTDVPTGRKSKHHSMVERILRELGDLRPKRALKIPRSALGSAKIEHIRAALSRASSKGELEIGTSVDDDYFYVWRQS